MLNPASRTVDSVTREMHVDVTGEEKVAVAEVADVGSVCSGENCAARGVDGTVVVYLRGVEG